MTLIDVIKNNNADIVIKVIGKDPDNECGCWSKEYYSGKLGKIPSHLRNCEVLDVAWSVGDECHLIEIPFLKKVDYFPVLSDRATEMLKMGFFK